MDPLTGVCIIIPVIIFKECTSFFFLRNPSKCALKHIFKNFVSQIWGYQGGLTDTHYYL